MAKTETRIACQKIIEALCSAAQPSKPCCSVSPQCPHQRRSNPTPEGVPYPRASLAAFPLLSLLTSSALTDVGCSALRYLKWQLPVRLGSADAFGTCCSTNVTRLLLGAASAKPWVMSWEA